MPFYFAATWYLPSSNFLPCFHNKQKITAFIPFCLISRHCRNTAWGNPHISFFHNLRILAKNAFSCPSPCRHSTKVAPRKKKQKFDYWIASPIARDPRCGSGGSIGPSGGSGLAAWRMSRASRATPAEVGIELAGHLANATPVPNRPINAQKLSFVMVSPPSKFSDSTQIYLWILNTLPKWKLL